MRILGIDPGSNATGYGVVERRGGCIVHVGHGTIRTPARRSLPERLAALQRGLRAALLEYAPELAVVEQVFVATNVRSALVLGQARGAILATLGDGGVPVDELAAREVKKAVTGTGSAEKGQVQYMVARLLALTEPLPRDAADALAVALCRAQMGPLAALGRPSSSRRSRVRSRRNLLAPGPRSPS